MDEDCLYDDLITHLQVKRRISSCQDRIFTHNETNGSAPKTKKNKITREESQNVIRGDGPHESAKASISASNQCQKEDTFFSHWYSELKQKHLDNLLSSTQKAQSAHFQWPALGNIKVLVPLESEDPTECPVVMNTLKHKLDAPRDIDSTSDLLRMGVVEKIVENVSFPLSPFQKEIFGLLSRYQDLYYPQRTFENEEELRSVYCLHALNHVLKTRNRILHHNAKLKAMSPSSSSLVPDSFRDQGLTRLKVLFIVPFRNSALQIVQTLGQLLNRTSTDSSKIMKLQRFLEEYTGNTLSFSKVNPKPEDYVKIFNGNTDDNFRIGITCSKKCLKLYTDFYSADIAIASPLALRLAIGGSLDNKSNHDFLNSIELLVIDQAELLMYQNWENLIYVFNHLHLQPQSLEHTNLQRVRSYCIDGLARVYRQTLLFSSHELPEFRGLYNSKCHNYAGKIYISNPVQQGDIRNVVVPITQVFYRLESPSLELVFEQRFQYFVNQLLPRFRSSSFGHCMIYVPNYFDYVRVRNYFKAEGISFVQISEYTKKEKVTRARDIFFHSGQHFLLYSERAHFFNRYRIKGIRHLVMYQPPMWPHFYSEMINLMHTANQSGSSGATSDMTVSVLYTKYDVMQLNAIIGTEGAAQLLKSDKAVHSFGMV